MTSRDDFVVISVQLCSTITGILESRVFIEN